jgi:transient receptor potential cation channel subfamily A protein 1
MNDLFLGNPEMVKLFIHENLDVNAPDMDDNTPLHLAASWDDDEEEDVESRKLCIKQLIDGKADVDALNIQQETPLHNASRSGSKKVVEFLLEHNADLLVTDIKGLNCLEMAIEEENEEVVKYFIKHGQIFELMRNAQLERDENGHIKSDGKADTPMRKLIVKMPDMALLMFDKCTIELGAEGTSSHRKTYNYEFLEDQYFVRSWEKSKKKTYEHSAKAKDFNCSLYMNMNTNSR